MHMAFHLKIILKVQPSPKFCPGSLPRLCLLHLNRTKQPMYETKPRDSLVTINTRFRPIVVPSNHEVVRVTHSASDVP